MSRNVKSQFTNEDSVLRGLIDLRRAWIPTITFANSPADDGKKDDDDKDDKGDGSGSDDGNGGSGASGSGASGQDGSTDTDDVKDPEKKRLSDEAANRRIQLKAEKERADKAELELRKLTDKDKSELEKAQRDLVEITKKAERLESVTMAQAVKLSFFESGAHALFRKPETALKLLDLSDLKPDDDGNVDNAEVKKRAEALLKTDAYLAADETSSGDDDGDKRASGQPNNGTKKNGKEADKEALMKKFPALRR